MMDKASAPKNGQGAEKAASRKIEQIAKIVFGLGKNSGKASRPKPSRKGNVVLDNGVELSLTHYMTYLGLKGILADQTAPKDPTAEDIAKWREDGTNTSTINQHLAILRDKGLAEWSMIQKEKPNGLLARMRVGLRLIELKTEEAEERLVNSDVLDEIRRLSGNA
jgi:hypothetical protein